jgi:ABC-type antimicrobial peptide transport system permease subunit
VNLANWGRSFFSAFSLFLLLVVGLGIRSTVCMNLFERMREFGTIRAIGFSRFSSFGIVFWEAFLLSLAALAAALLAAAVPVLLFIRTGIYIGSEPMAYVFGGEYFCPRLAVKEVALALAAVAMLSFISPFKPGLVLCYQSIVDLLARRQGKIFATVAWLKDRLVWLERG